VGWISLQVQQIVRESANGRGTSHSHLDCTESILPGTIEALFVGGPKLLQDDRGEWTSSIARDRVHRPIRLSALGIEGDKVAQPYHGGTDAAACVHVAEHYVFWRERYGVHLTHGYLGENLLLGGIEESTICAGDILEIGSALVQVSGPRVPCENQARRVGRTDWVKLTIRENRTGFYLRVLEAGVVQQGAPWELQERLNDHASIPAINRCFYLEFDPGLASEFAEMPGLAEWWKEQFREKLSRKGRHWSEDILL
jgi:MOSC domain-containing protein YiiM